MLTGRITKFTLLGASSLTVMAGAVVAPALPAIGHAFPRASELHIKLIVTLPALVIACLAPLSGLIIDRFGRKPTLLAALLLYALAGTTGLYMTTLGGILVGRALLGLAVAGVMTASTTLLGDLFHGDERRNMMGWQASAMAFGGVLFLMGGGQLAALHWRGPFAVYLLALLFVPMVLLAITEPLRARHTDAESSTLVPPEAGLAHLGEPTPWGVVVLIYFTAFAGMVMFYLVPVQIPYLLRQLADADGASIGFAIGCNSFMAGVMTLLYGRVKRRLGFYPIFAIIFTILSVAYFTIGFAGSFGGVLAGLLITGIGLGWVMPNLSLCLLAAAPPQMRGRLVGGLTATYFLGQFLSPILVHPIVTHSGISNAFRYSALAMIAIAAFFAVLSLAGRRATIIPARDTTQVPRV